MLDTGNVKRERKVKPPPEVESHKLFVHVQARIYPQSQFKKEFGDTSKFHTDRSKEATDAKVRENVYS